MTNIPQCPTEAVVVGTETGTGRGSDCLRCLETIPLREEEEEGGKTEVFHLTTLPPLPQRLQSPAPKP